MIRVNVPSTGAFLTWLPIEEPQSPSLLNRACHGLEPLHISDLRREGPERQYPFVVLKRIPLRAVELPRQFLERHLQRLMEGSAAVLLNRLVRYEQGEHLRFRHRGHPWEARHLARIIITVPF